MSTTEENKRRQSKTISFPTHGEFHVASFTDFFLEIIQKSTVPIMDAHMHIQSNNIAPCTIQWGTIRALLAGLIANYPDEIEEALKKVVNITGAIKWIVPFFLPLVEVVAFLLQPAFKKYLRSHTLGISLVAMFFADLINELAKYLQNKDLDDVSNLALRQIDKELLNTVQACISPIFMGDFGKLGVLDTDVVAQVFMGYDKELIVQNYAVTYQTYKQIKEIYGLENEDSLFENFVVTRASKMFLHTMSEEEAKKLMMSRQEMMANFSHFTKHYFNNLERAHLYITLPMDLGFAHYWGYHSLPIYLQNNDEELYFISEMPYYLSFSDNLRFSASFITKKTKKEDKIPPEKVKELVRKNVEKKIIKDTEKSFEKFDSTIDSKNKQLDRLHSHFKNDTDVTGKMDDIQKDLAGIKELLRILHLGKTSTRETGIIQRLSDDVIDFIDDLIDEYVNESSEKKKEQELYAHVPPEIAGARKVSEELARDADELYKSYHALSCLAGKRIEDLDDFFEEHLKTLKKQLKRKFLRYVTQCISNLSEIQSATQSGRGSSGTQYLKRNFNFNYDKVKENIDNVHQEIRFIGDRLKSEINLLKEQIKVYSIGYNKILRHSTKPGEYSRYFKFNSLLQKDVENGSVVDKIPDDRLETVSFPGWAVDLPEEEIEKLDRMIDDLLQNHGMSYIQYGNKIPLLIKGHTGATPSREADRKYSEDLYKLSLRRAEATKGAILELLDGNKFLFEITVKGCSYHEPIASNASEQGKSKNRRAEIYILRGGISRTDDEYDKFINKSMNHYLETAPGNELKYYESYPVHLTRIIASGLRYPLKLLPFYKYDPRRHYAGGDTFLKKLIKDIKENHGFFTLTHGENMQKPLLTPVDFTESYFMYWLKKTKMTNEYAFDHVDLGKIGICWGFKMYTMLGFPPNMYDTKSYPGPDDSFEGRFDHYKAFFKYCVDNKIPITCHGSPNAMTIADTILYLKEYEKEEPESSEFKDQLYSHIPEEIKESLQFVDDSFVRPESWRKVLDTEGLGELKLNLAHFTGYDSWFVPKDKDGKIIPPPKYANPDWRDEMIGLIRDYENVYTDISCYNNEEEQLKEKLSVSEYRDNIDDLKDEEYKRLYEKAYQPVYWDPRTRFSILHYKLVANKEEQRIIRRILRRAGIINDYLEEVAENLAEKISKEPKLKTRIMMGSDWPMFERSFAGAGEYYSRMFELLSLVTKFLKEKHGQTWDAWHQFSVINPLRFLGILKGEDGEKMTLDMEKIEGHRAAIEKFLDYEGDDKKEQDLIKKYRISKDIDKILKTNSGQHSLSGNFEKLKQINQFKINQSDKILDPDDNDNLLILKV